jgi:PAS domain S-box-containing protein
VKPQTPPSAGQGEVSESMREKTRPELLLEALEQYPASLQTVVNTAIHACHPMCVFWGAQAQCFYNDAFLQATRLSMPAGSFGAPGRQVLPDMWKVLCEHVDEVMNDGKASWHEDQLIPMMRNGALEDVYWTYSCSPIVDAAAGNAVSGVLTILNDCTRQVALVKQAREEREQFAELFQQAPTFMTMLSGPEHRVELVSPGYQRLIGDRQIVGRTIAEALPEIAEQGYVGLLDEVYSSGQPFSAKSAKYKLQNTPDGMASERFLDFVYQPIKDSAGRVKGIFVEGVDVTDHVLAENRRNALIRLSDDLRNLESPDEITFKAAQILGETLGASRVGYGTIDPVADTLWVERDWTAPDTESLAGTLNLRDFGSFVDGLKLGKFIVINDVAQDSRTSMATDVLTQRRVGAFVSVPIVEQGQLVAVLYIVSPQPRNWTADEVAFIKEVAERARTASERLRSELALRESEAKFRTIAEAVPQMVWSTLPNGFHDYYNEQWYEFTGVDKGSTNGEKWNDMFHPDDRAHAWEVWKHCLETGENYEIQYRLRHHSGEYRWTLGRALPVRDAAGKIIRWMGTCTDIHSQKLAEVELSEISHRKDEFLAMLAHELRNPLAPIDTAAQLLRISKADEKQVKHASDIISRQVKHMTDLVDDLLDVSRVSRGLVELEKEQIDIKQVVSIAIEQARPLIEARKHSLNLKMGSDDAYVKGDKTRLVQVIANLLNNAAKYTQQGGEIALTVAVQKNKVKISVADNGIGIDTSLLPHVFDLFTQGERTPDRAQGGLGLGLSLVKSITALHGGKVAAESEGTGMGSSFSIILPLLPAEEIVHGNAMQSGTMPTQASPLRLMIVDDNLDAASSLAALLDAKGHYVTVKETAISALKAARKGEHQAFILDIGLPDMDGYELARCLRANKSTADATIIALTGYGQAHDRVLSKAAGFDHHCVKPINVQQLDSILASVGAETDRSG